MLFECYANFLTCDRRSRTQSAVLSEVLNGTNHLRGVGVLVVVPRHDLNLIGVVVAALIFCAFPSSSSQFCNNSYSTRTYRCRTRTGLSVPQLYHVSASFARIWFVSLLTCIFNSNVYFYSIPRFERLRPRASAGAAALPDTLLRSSMTARLPTCSCWLTEISPDVILSHGVGNVAISFDMEQFYSFRVTPITIYIRKPRELPEL